MERAISWILVGLLPLGSCGGDGGGATGPGDGSSAVFQEIDGTVAVEAENFSEYRNLDKPREWVLTTASEAPGITPDPDPPHTEGASGEAYLELLPDTRVTDEDPIAEGESIYNNRGTGPTLDYQVNFTATGTYFVWVRAYSTGGEDNGIHVGIDGEYPDSGYRIQFCSGKNRWTWSSALRDSGGEVCGVPLAAQIEVSTPGVHTVSFSAREDGFEFDKFVLSTDAGFEPTDTGPDEAVGG